MSYVETGEVQPSNVHPYGSLSEEYRSLKYIQQTMMTMLVSMRRTFPTLEVLNTKTALLIYKLTGDQRSSDGPTVCNTIQNRTLLIVDVLLLLCFFFVMVIGKAIFVYGRPLGTAFFIFIAYSVLIIRCAYLSTTRMVANAAMEEEKTRNAVAVVPIIEPSVQSPPSVRPAEKQNAGPKSTPRMFMSDAMPSDAVHLRSQNVVSTIRVPFVAQHVEEVTTVQTEEKLHGSMYGLKWLGNDFEHVHWVSANIVIPAIICGALSEIMLTAGWRFLGIPFGIVGLILLRVNADIVLSRTQPRLTVTRPVSDNVVQITPYYTRLSPTIRKHLGQAIHIFHVFLCLLFGLLNVFLPNGFGIIGACLCGVACYVSSSVFVRYIVVAAITSPVDVREYTNNEHGTWLSFTCGGRAMYAVGASLASFSILMSMAIRFGGASVYTFCDFFCAILSFVAWLCVTYSSIECSYMFVPSAIEKKACNYLFVGCDYMLKFFEISDMDYDEHGSLPDTSPLQEKHN